MHLEEEMSITLTEFFEILPAFPNTEFDGLQEVTTGAGCIAHPGQAKSSLDVRFGQGHLQILLVIYLIDFFRKHVD